MRYAGKEAETPEMASLKAPLKAILAGLGFELIELVVSRHRGSVQVRAVIFNGSSIGIDDCSRAHRAITPRLELAFAGQDIHLEVSSPGINRQLKDGAEFAYYTGMVVRCYRTDISDWTAGILEAVDENGVVLKTKEGVIKLDFDVIAKANLTSREV
jgi:ribosome maturation factor RimP